MKPEIVRTIADLRPAVAAWRADGQGVGMVPTMGALHEGHLELVRKARDRAARVVVTLFVNPTQFAPTEDLSAYPRNEEADRAKLSDLAVDLLFAPGPSEMYPAGFDTRVEIGGAARGLESDFRPEHFGGVATVVAKLLLAGLPDFAMFGEKDYQQLLVVKQLVRDLNIPVEIVGCPTVRETDGLALSSRNVYLSPDERRRAPRLNAVLREMAAAIGDGGEIPSVLERGRSALASVGFVVDYLALRDAQTLAPVEAVSDRPLRLLAAARLGRTRLIDNLAV